MSVPVLNVSTTVSSAEDARRIAREVVRRRLAACAQIAAVESCYQWRGTLQAEREYRVEFKTTQDRYREIEQAIRELHPYELPDIHAVGLDQVFAPYADWVEQGSPGETAVLPPDTTPSPE